MDEKRLERFLHVYNQELVALEKAPGRYYSDSGPYYESIGQVRARFNRLVVYPSFLLHSGLVEPGLLSDDPRMGRLTANIFVAPIFTPQVAEVAAIQ